MFPFRVPIDLAQQITSQSAAGALRLRLEGRALQAAHADDAPHLEALLRRDLASLAVRTALVRLGWEKKKAGAKKRTPWWF